MKADSPAPKIVKFGMATDETHRIVERHFALMEEHQLLAGGVLDHNLRVACIAKEPEGAARREASGASTLYQP